MLEGGGGCTYQGPSEMQNGALLLEKQGTENPAELQTFFLVGGVGDCTRDLIAYACLSFE